MLLNCGVPISDLQQSSSASTVPSTVQYEVNHVTQSLRTVQLQPSLYRTEKEKSPVLTAIRSKGASDGTISQSPAQFGPGLHSGCRRCQP